MKLKSIHELNDFKLHTLGDPEREISRIYCCDLLSIAMSRAPSDGVWVTVMGNRNAVAVASLTNTACIILAEGVGMDEATLEKATEEGISVLSTELPVFDAALKIHEAAQLCLPSITIYTYIPAFRPAETTK